MGNYMKAFYDSRLEGMEQLNFWRGIALLIGVGFLLATVLLIGMARLGMV